MVIKEDKAIFSDGVTLELRGASLPEGEYNLTQKGEEALFWSIIDLNRAHLDLELASSAVEAFRREINLLLSEEEELLRRKEELQKRLMGALNGLVAVQGGV